MPDDLSPQPLHGRTDRLQVPTHLEVGGKLVSVVHYRARHDLGMAWNAATKLSQMRHYWEVWLSDGRNMVVYWDLLHPGWYEDPAATRGAEADAACAEIERRAEESVARLREQNAQEAEREARGKRIGGVCWRSIPLIAPADGPHSGRRAEDGAPLHRDCTDLAASGATLRANGRG